MPLFLTVRWVMECLKQMEMPTLIHGIKMNTGIQFYEVGVYPALLLNCRFQTETGYILIRHLVLLVLAIKMTKGNISTEVVG